MTVFKTKTRNTQYIQCPECRYYKLIPIPNITFTSIMAWYCIKCKSTTSNTEKKRK